MKTKTTPTHVDALPSVSPGQASAPQVAPLQMTAAIQSRDTLLIEGGFTVSQLKGTNLSNGVSAKLQANSSIRLHVGYEHVWNSPWATEVNLGLQRLNTANLPTLYRYGIVQKYSLSKRFKLGVAARLEEDLYFDHLDLVTLRIHTYFVPELLLHAEYTLYQSETIQIGTQDELGFAYRNQVNPVYLGTLFVRNTSTQRLNAELGFRAYDSGLNTASISESFLDLGAYIKLIYSVGE